jgi:hypothetical protein
LKVELKISLLYFQFSVKNACKPVFKEFTCFFIPYCRQGDVPARGSKLICLQTGKSVRWKKTAEGIEVALPAGLPKDLPAIAFEMSAGGKA